MTKIANNPGITKIPTVDQPLPQKGVAKEPAAKPAAVATGIAAVEGDEAGLAAAVSADKLLALTLDDGPDPQTTPRILDVLARYEARQPAERPWAPPVALLPLRFRPA